MFNNEKCSQHPKTIRTTKIDYILGFFYFYYTLIFDTSNKRREKAIHDFKQQKRIFDVQIAENEKKLNSSISLIKAVENAIEKDPENYLKHFERLNKYEESKKETEIKLSELRDNLTKLELQYSDSMAKKEFKKIFADWYKFYFNTSKNSTEKNRAEIIKLLAENPEGTIKNGITLFSDYLVIQTDSNLFFIFKIDRNDKTLTPYQKLPIEELINNKAKFFNDFNEIWQRFQSGNLDYENSETQEYLKNKFQWKTFIVSNKNIELDVKIPFPENSKVIFFEESIEEDEKKLKDRERKRKWAEKKKLEKLNSIE